MDTFVEQIVVKKKDSKEIAIIIGSILAAMILVFASISFLIGPLSMILILLLFGIGYGLWWLITSQNKEFEYSVTNGDIDIDIIIAKRKRKRIVSVTGHKIESVQPYNESIMNHKFDRIVMAAPSLTVPELWCFTYRSKKNGHTLVVFQPEQRVLDALKVGLSTLVLREMNKKTNEK